jgi:hypothetical protein
MLPVGSRVVSKSKDWSAGICGVYRTRFATLPPPCLRWNWCWSGWRFLLAVAELSASSCHRVELGIIVTANYAVLNYLVLCSQSSCWMSCCCDVSSHYKCGTVWTNLPRFGIVYESMPKNPRSSVDYSHRLSNVSPREARSVYLSNLVSFSRD